MSINPDQPLSDFELDWLDNFLMDRIEEQSLEEEALMEGDEGILDVSELDGFFTAIVSGPTVVLPSQWLPEIWGDFEPVFDDIKDYQMVMSLMMRHMNQIASTLMEQPDWYEPLFLARNGQDQKGNDKEFLVVDEWCEGYMRGVRLALDQWHLDQEEMRRLISPIIAFTGEAAMVMHKNLDDKELEILQSEILPATRDIHAYWLARRKPGDVPQPVRTVRNNEIRVGRNDPCPCGSGKKYKKCCLH